MPNLNRRSVLIGGLALPAWVVSRPGRADGPTETLPAALRGEPRLQKPVTVQWRRAPLPGVVREIGRQAAVSIEAAADVTDEPAADWLREGNFFRIRHRRWYEIRLAELPDRTADRWATFLRARPHLSLEELGRLVLELRDEQLRESFEAAMEECGVRLPELFDQVVEDNPRGTRAALRAYAGLPPLQKEQLGRGRPVAWRALPATGRGWLRGAFREWFEEMPAPEALAAGALAVSLYDVERVVTPADDGHAID
jgi:hypothetical protein